MSLVKVGGSAANAGAARSRAVKTTKLRIMVITPSSVDLFGRFDIHLNVRVRPAALKAAAAFAAGIVHLHSHHVGAGCAEGRPRGSSTAACQIHLRRRRIKSDVAGTSVLAQRDSDRRSATVARRRGGFTAGLIADPEGEFGRQSDGC